MTEVLSQVEIDALLNALNAGELDVKEIREEKEEKKVRAYDFKIPNKFAKDQLRTLQMIHENFSRVLQTYLSGYLLSFVQIEVVSVDQLTYYEFSNSMPNPSTLGVIDFSPLSGSILMEITPSISFTMIEKILGGAGQAYEENRIFTEIELTIIEKILNQILNLYKDPWKNVADLKPKLSKIETNTQFAQIMSPNETIALVTLNVKIGNVEGSMHICIPHIVIEPIIPKLSTKFWFSGLTKDVSSNEIRNLEKRIEKTYLPLSVVLGKSVLNVKDILNLQKGDVITLDKSANEELEVFVGSKLKFYCYPGIKKNKVAVKITRIEKRGDEADE
ncbi:flagellar motor switch protein FliM [Lutispora thermophila]|uniref:Flagellar motor switch protein FliM n=1 Tax=Lutispora thermophila DSM 19022 TaxID=1122184 RepID=A0A1M6G7G7_9FIRM|nr:flagellar motor switch protein FliM [Lutispora thermophila]SHJ05844.1 flagellar motor switch protein FliM [Lutispora thermophila DSM 19022]